MTIKSFVTNKLHSIERFATLPLVAQPKNLLYPNGYHTSRLEEFWGGEALLAFLDNVVATRFEGSQPLPGYPFRRSLLTDQDIFDPASPILQFCLQEAILKLVKSHLPFEPFLRSVELWVDTAEVSQNGPIETQYYHLDGDDSYNLKCFLYLSDVTLEHGPFTFFPVHYKSATSLIGRPRGINNTSRIKDNSLESPEKKGVHFVGTRGSLIFADTCWGYHKGLLPRVGRRILFTFQFTSKNPYWGPVMVIPDQLRDSVKQKEMKQILTKKNK